ncbi:DUF4861 family protein [Hephaestia mangrovi]|uniref:DUF4861 family protein n=1 Tax=Hephaestia mangrovi TaxID=2873268 RepID=UPI002106AB10|nr:DUF4861 family protein [Hephaestia mangrovi]
MIGRLVAMATLLALTAGAAPRPSPMPISAKSTLPPPSPQERKKRAEVVFAPYRYGDILWENDRTAHRIYGRPLEAIEPPSSSGIDAWGKSVPWPFADRQLRTGDQHENHGEGLDFYNVDTSRGAGGLGIWQDHKLWVSRNYAHYRILQNGPDVASFEVSYDPWPVGVDRKVWETRRFTLPAGTNFTRMVSTISSDKPDPLVVGIGIAKRPTDPVKLGNFDADAKTGRFVWWGPTNPGKGAMGVAIMVDPQQVVGVTADFDNYLVLVTVQPGKPFVYYSGAAWSRGGDIQTMKQWKDYVYRQRPNFAPGDR